MKKTSNDAGLQSSPAGLKSLAVLFAFCAIADQVLAQQDGAFWISAGPLIRGGMNVKVSGSSYAATLGSQGLGDRNAYDDRTYDDGYVRRDSSGGGGIAPNTTWNWGYDNAGQYDAAAGTLMFQRQGVPQYDDLSGNGGSIEEDMLGGGFQLLCGIPLRHSEKWGVDLVFGFQGVWGENELRENSGYVTIRDTYNVAGIAPFPAAGHHGTFDGPFDPAGVPPFTVIPNLPGSRTATPFAAAPGVQSSVSLDVDQGLYVFSLGPDISYSITERIRLHATPKITLNVIDVDVNRSETFMFGDGTGVQQIQDRDDNLKTVAGLGITGGVDWNLGKGWFTGIFGGYEYVPDESKFVVGPNTVELDASGWVAGLQVGRSF